MDLKEFNLLWISNFFCDFLQIDYSLLNQSCEIFFYYVNIFLWHPVGNLIVTKLKRRIIFLQVRQDFMVSPKLILNFNIVGRINFKLSKKDFFLDLLVLFLELL